MQSLMLLARLWLFGSVKARALYCFLWSCWMLEIISWPTFITQDQEWKVKTFHKVQWAFTEEVIIIGEKQQQNLTLSYNFLLASQSMRAALISYVWLYLISVLCLWEIFILTVGLQHLKPIMILCTINFRAI